MWLTKTLNNMTQKQIYLTMYTFILFGLAALISLCLANATAFLWCAAIADVFGLALVINALTIKKRRRAE